jgi:hypothetical protein
MAKTANSYVTNQGEVKVTLSAGNITSVGAPFVTAETITLDGAVRSFKRTNDPERAVEDTYVTGDTTPIITPSSQIPHEEWELVLVDDYYEALTGGEWGTDGLAAVEIFQELYDHRVQPGGVKCTPAGGASGDVQITLTAPIIVKSISRPMIDADATRPSEVIVKLDCPGSTTATYS